MSDYLRAHDRVLERFKGLHKKAIDLSLDRMQRLCAVLGDPQRRLPPVVHVAGTNGKGSTIATLRAVAEAAGLSVHVFSSPHLVRFAERIRLAGRLIDDDQLTEVLDRVERLNAGAPITFFEITTAAAFLAMSEAPADLCLVEVGLGGRFDCTNVVEGVVLSVIAPVALDHTEFLGETLGQIAFEKAGILRPGVPAVIGHQQAEALDVIEARAAEVGAPLIEMGRDFDAWGAAGRTAVQVADRLYDLPAPGLTGAHQIDNAGLAVAAALALRHEGFTEAVLAEGVARASWPGRLQRLTRGPLADFAAAAGADLWLDGAHNPHGAAALADFARALTARDGRPVTMIVGLLANKDVAGVLEALAAASPRIVATGFDAEAALDPIALAAKANGAGLKADAAHNVTEAVRLALSADGPAPHLIICGSLYLAGEVLSLSPETWPT
ncbi:MAG: bifunctional folylpolyglutamate synthase/dihydrofolate synthase [Caulobacterales bacterium 32-69-10]|nr:MAG: bifunctional folylpolyglutamate synthase/dihydrofolate synthase [Caulobacterales bacterium 32-69-10]